MLRLLALGALFENKSEEVVGPKGKEMRYVYTDPHLSLAEACPGVVNSWCPVSWSYMAPQPRKVLRLRVTSVRCKKP